MSTLKQSVSVNGTVLSNNDPDMVITLDSNPGVQISSIQDDSITYEFIGEVTQDTTYSLNLTFAYKGTHRVVVPLTLTHKLIETLTVTTSPEETTGGTGDTFTITPTILSNGSEIAVNDPSLTISVTPDGELEIVEITETTVVVKVASTQEQATDFIAQLVVSKGSLQAIAPWLHHYTIPAPEYKIIVTQNSTMMQAAENNLILFTLKDGDGNPITDATKVSMDVTETPKSRFVLAGYSNTMVNMNSTSPGQYRLSMNLGETAGTFKIALTVAVPGKTDGYALPDMTFNNPGSPVKSSVNVDTIDAEEGKGNAVTVSLTRSKYLQANAPATGYLHILTIDGPASSITPSLLESTDGTYPLTIVSNGEEGEINVTAEFAPVVNGITWDPLPVTFKVNAVAIIPTPTLSETTTSMSLNLWETKAVGYKVMVGDEDITSTASVTLADTIDDSIEFVTISDGVYGFKAVKADPLEDTKLPAKVNVNVSYGGNDYTLPIDLEITVLANTSGIPANRFNVDFV